MTTRLTGLTITTVMKRITLHQARTRAHLTQVQLAAAADLDQAYVSKLELGKIAAPSFDTVLRLSKALGIDPQSLKFEKPDSQAVA